MSQHDPDEDFVVRREGLGEISPESHPELQVHQRLVPPPSFDPPGSSPGRITGMPAGRRFIKHISPPGGRPYAPTGRIAAPDRVIDPNKGVPVYDERHPLPVQLPRECWDYMFSLLRQFLVKVEKPSWIEPPARAKPIDRYTPTCGATIPPGGSASVVDGGFTMPAAGHIGFIVKFGMALDVAASWSTTTFTLTKNGVPIQEYIRITSQLGRVEEPSILPVPIALQPGDTINLLANNGGAAPIQAYGRIAGWFFPVQVSTSDGSFRERLVD